MQLVELEMMKLSWAIRSKRDWQIKMKDQNILDKWKKEAFSSQEGLTRDVVLTEKMVTAFESLRILFD